MLRPLNSTTDRRRSFACEIKSLLPRITYIKLAKLGLTKQTTIQANEILIYSSDISEHFIMQNDNKPAEQA